MYEESIGKVWERYRKGMGKVWEKYGYDLKSL